MCQSALKQDYYPYTYEDIRGFDEDVRAEVIDGALFVHEPPETAHQEAVGGLFLQLANYVKAHPGEGKVFVAPFGVRLFPQTDGRDSTFLEPDIVLVRNAAQIDRKGCNGAPDMIIEVLSSSTARIDRVLKLNKYLKAGVKEYWMVDAYAQDVTVCTLADGQWQYSHYAAPGKDFRLDEAPHIVPVKTLPGFSIDLAEVFPQDA